MDFLARLERRLGWLTVANLPIFLVTGQALAYLWVQFGGGSMFYLVLDPAAVFGGGEFWRVFTFIFVVPIQNPIFAFFYLYLLYVYGSALENAWGSFSFTLFYLIGVLGHIVAGLLFGNRVGAFYLNLSVFLAFAALHPDFRLFLFFIVPVKVRWLAWATWVWVALSFLVAPLAGKAAIAVSIMNYLLFFTKGHINAILEVIARERRRRRFRE